MTFNYDTLIEARYDALGSAEDAGSFDHRDLSDLMPLAGVIDGGGPGPRPSSFWYWKLHGSIHWYWDPITRSADSMVQVDLPARWRASAHATDPAELVLELTRFDGQVGYVPTTSAVGWTGMVPAVV